MTVAAGRLLDEPFRGGRVRRRHRCIACGQPTRRTIASYGGRTVLCSRCPLPPPEALLLRAVLGVESTVDLIAHPALSRRAPNRGAPPRRRP
jgi:hypothetical protein